MFFNVLSKVPLGLIGNPVRIGNGPAAVFGDEICKYHCFVINRNGKAQVEDDPRVRRPALSIA